MPGDEDGRRPEEDPAVATAAIVACHDRAVETGEPGYLDPVTGLFVLTSAYLLEQGSCCGRGCRHCPF